jgi:hypothetical protein
MKIRYLGILGSGACGFPLKVPSKERAEILSGEFHGVPS